MDFCAYLIKIAKTESAYDPALADDIARAVAPSNYLSSIPTVAANMTLGQYVPGLQQILYPLTGLSIAGAGSTPLEQFALRDFLNAKSSKIQAEKLRDASAAAEEFYSGAKGAVPGALFGAQVGGLLGYLAPNITSKLVPRFMTYSRHPYAGALIGGSLGGLGSYLFTLLKQKKLREAIEESVKLHGMKTAADDNALLKRKAKVNLWRLADKLRALPDVKEQLRGKRINSFREKYEQTSDSTHPAFVAAGAGIGSMGVGKILSKLISPRYERSEMKPVIMSKSTGLAPFIGPKERTAVLLSGSDKPIGSAVGLGPDKVRVMAKIKEMVESKKWHTPHAVNKWHTFDVTQKQPFGSKLLGKIGPSLSVAVPIAATLLGAWLSVKSREKNKEKLMKDYALLGPEEKAMAEPLI